MADRLPAVVQSDGLVHVDCGVGVGLSGHPIVGGERLTLVVVRPDLVTIDHVHVRLDGLRRLACGKVVVAVAGDCPLRTGLRGRAGRCMTIAVALDPDGSWRCRAAVGLQPSPGAACVQVLAVAHDRRRPGDWTLASRRDDPSGWSEPAPRALLRVRGERSWRERVGV